MSREYKKDEFDYFVYQPTGKYEVVRSKAEYTRKRPILERIIINFEDIEKLDLENKGEQVPFTHKHVVNTPLYLLYYWSPIIGDRACFLYLQLLTYCREEKDFLWDKLKEIAVRMKTSQNTLNKYLTILEEHNFIIKIHRNNKLDNNRQTSPIIKVRQSIPILSKELYEQLPDRLKIWHDEFMNKYGRNTFMPEQEYDANETLNELLSNGQKIINSKTKKKIQDLLQEEQALDYIKMKLQYSSNLKTTEFHEFLLNNQQLVTKASYETFFVDSILYYDEELNNVDFVARPLTKTFFSEQYNGEYYKGRLHLAIHHLYGLKPEVYKLNIFTFEEYMELLSRRV
ncbi:hypothetical protein D7X33_24300 [Butyricicoccus sp. 1XD8-22]|nr:hypothetical protein D7X33_24300 [Butyricicoccus sp. 1XD8-22]